MARVGMKVQSEEKTREALKKLEAFLDSKGEDKRINQLAEAIEQLGGEDTGQKIIDLNVRSRAEVHQAIQSLKKAIGTQDPTGIELAMAKCLTVLGSEKVMHSILASAMMESLFLVQEDTAKQAVFYLVAPKHFGNLLKLLKTSVKERSGRSVTDSDILMAVVTYAMVGLEDFLQQSYVVGSSSAAATKASTNVKRSKT